MALGMISFAASILTSLLSDSLLPDPLRMLKCSTSILPCAFAPVVTSVPIVIDRRVAEFDLLIRGHAEEARVDVRPFVVDEDALPREHHGSDDGAEAGDHQTPAQAAERMRSKKPISKNARWQPPRIKIGTHNE